MPCHMSLPSVAWLHNPRLPRPFSEHTSQSHNTRTTSSYKTTPDQSWLATRVNTYPQESTRFNTYQFSTHYQSFEIAKKCSIYIYIHIYIYYIFSVLFIYILHFFCFIYIYFLFSVICFRHFILEPFCSCSKIHSVQEQRLLFVLSSKRFNAR